MFWIDACVCGRGVFSGLLGGCFTLLWVFVDKFPFKFRLLRFVAF